LHYVITLPRGPNPTSDSDFVHVVAMADGTNVQVNDGILQSFQVNADLGVSVEVRGPAVVVSDEPVEVFLYEKSERERGRLGDPVVGLLGQHRLPVDRGRSADSGLGWTGGGLVHVRGRQSGGGDCLVYRDCGLRWAHGVRCEDAGRQRAWGSGEHALGRASW